MSMKSIYDKYKNDYSRLPTNKSNESSTIPNFSNIVEKAYDSAIRRFEPMYTIIDDDAYQIFRMHKFGEDKRYTPNRYAIKESAKEEKPLKCENRKFIVNNPDITYELVEEKKEIFTDTWINKLPVNDSTGETKWESYNWTLYRDPDKKFHMAFARLTNSFEIGIKHTMIGKQNDFYAGGELRIVHDVNNFNKKIVQVNLDSSSFGPGFANIFKNLCYSYIKCANKDVMQKNIEERFKSTCPFGSRMIASVVCENFEEKYNDILDFKIIGSIPKQPKSHFEEPEKSKKYEKLQEVLDLMTIIIKDVMKQIFQQMINEPDYVVQIVGDQDWYDVGLGGHRGLHWYYYNDVCPSDEYINEINKWGAEKQQTGLLIKEVKNEK